MDLMSPPYLLISIEILKPQLFYFLEKNFNNKSFQFHSNELIGISLFTPAISDLVEIDISFFVYIYMRWGAVYVWAFVCSLLYLIKINYLKSKVITYILTQLQP